MSVEYVSLDNEAGAHNQEWGHMADYPNCPRCKTDDFLEYSEFVPGHNETRSFGSWGGPDITRTNWIGPVVHFTCIKCGHRNGHTVPDDWNVPIPNPKVTPGRPFYQQADGSFVI